MAPEAPRDSLDFSRDAQFFAVRISRETVCACFQRGLLNQEEALHRDGSPFRTRLWCWGCFPRWRHLLSVNSGSSGRGGTKENRL